MKKRIGALALAGAMMLGMTGCGQKTENDTQSVAPSDFVEKKVEPVSFESGVELQENCKHLIYALGNAPATIDAAKYFKMRVEQESKGAMTVDIYTDNVLGSERELLESCQFGDYDIVLATNATVAAFCKDIYCLDIPWLFDNKQQVYEVLDGALGNYLGEQLKEVGFQLLQWQENAFRTLSTTNTPVESMSDLKGLKIRIMENELQLAQWKAYGTNPTPMAFTELFTALQQGTVDGQDNGAELTWQSKFYEVQEYYVYTKHIYSPYIILMSGERFNQLTPEEQEIILRVSDEAVAYERQRCSKYEAIALENIKSYPGMNYAELTPETIAQMREACTDIKEMAYGKVEHPEVIDLLYEEVEKAKQKYPEEKVVAEQPNATQPVV